MASPTPTPAPHDVYAIFVDDINQGNTNRIAQGITGAMAAGNKHAHIMFQSWGGFVGDGVMLYNFFRSLSALDLSLYNSGQVASAAVIAASLSVWPPCLLKKRNRPPTRDYRMRPSPSVKRCTSLIRVSLATSLINRDVL